MASWSITPEGAARSLLTTIQHVVLGPEDKGSPRAAYRMLAAKRDFRESALSQAPMVRVWDEQHHLVGQVPVISLRGDELAADTGTCSFAFPGEHHVANWLRRGRRPESDVHVTIDPIPTQRTWRDRWGGKASLATFKRTDDGQQLCEIQAAHHREHLKHVVFANNPIAPPEAQGIRFWLMPGPTRTVVYTTLLLNLAQQYFPPLTLIDSFADPARWATINPLDVSPLNWPVQPQFVNPLLDTSMLTVLTASFTDAHTATADVLKAAGCQIRAYTWLPEDEDSPHPELEAVIGPLARPSRACVVLACEDKSGVVGPTGTIFDSVVSFGAKLLDDSLTEVLIPLDLDGDGATDPFFRALTLTAPEKPHVVFREGNTTGVIESSYSHAPATAHTVSTGKGSPPLVNDGISFGVKYGLARLQDLMQGGQFGGTWQVPGTPGLDELYQGQLSNRVLTHMRWTDALRAIRSGDYAYIAKHEQSAVGYSVAGGLAIQAGLWKARPRTTKHVRVRNGFPHWIGRAGCELGDRVLHEHENVLFADHIGAVGIEMEEDGKVDRPVQIGEDDDQENPISSALKAVQGIWGAIGAFGGADGGI